MMQKNEQPANVERVPRVRRPYHSPSLSEYGAIQELTATGSGAVTEAGNSTNNPQKRP